MKETINAESISKFFIISILFGVIMISLVGFDRLDETNGAKEKEHAVEIINKALVQCYSLEGSYPSDIKDLTRYGVRFDDEKYIYHYEPFGNHIPSVTILDIK